MRYNIRSIPCVVLFVKGEPVDAIIGAAPKEAYRRMIDATIKK